MSILKVEAWIEKTNAFTRLFMHNPFGNVGMQKKILSADQTELLQNVGRSYVLENTSLW